MKDENVFEHCVDLLEEKVFQIDIIKSFELRGWALYECDTYIDFLNFLDFQYIVEMGREKKFLKHNKRYVLFPLNQDDSNWDVIRDLSYRVARSGRAPYFVELDSSYDKNHNKQIWPIARYLIDSVTLVPPNLILHIDPRFSNTKDPKRTDIKPNIVLHLSELWKIRKQLMKALREKI